MVKLRLPYSLQYSDLSRVFMKSWKLYSNWIMPNQFIHSLKAKLFIKLKKKLSWQSELEEVYDISLSIHVHIWLIIFILKYPFLEEKLSDHPRFWVMPIRGNIWKTRNGWESKHMQSLFNAHRRAFIKALFLQDPVQRWVKLCLRARTPRIPQSTWQTLSQKVVFPMLLW